MRRPVRPHQLELTFVEEHTGQAVSAPAMGKARMMETREAKAMSCAVAPDQRQARRKARLELVRQVKLGATASEAQRRSSVPMHRTTVYRLLKLVKCEGEDALVERRHGHPVKLREEVLTFVLDYCQDHVSAASREVQHLVAERFGITVSISQLNRVRAAHGLSRKAPKRCRVGSSMV